MGPKRNELRVQKRGSQEAARDVAQPRGAQRARLEQIARHLRGSIGRRGGLLVQVHIADISWEKVLTWIP